MHSFPAAGNGSRFLLPGGERRKRCPCGAFVEDKSDLSESCRVRCARREFRPRCARDSLRNEQCEALQASSAKIEIADIRTHSGFGITAGSKPNKITTHEGQCHSDNDIELKEGQLTIEIKR